MAPEFYFIFFCSFTAAEGGGFPNGHRRRPNGGARGAQRWRLRRHSRGGRGKSRRRRVFREYKINLINCLLDRAYKISSTHLSFTNEIEKLKTFFSQKNFTNVLVDRTINKSLKNIFSPELIIAKISKKVIYASIPPYHLCLVILTH